MKAALKVCILERRTEISSDFNENPSDDEIDRDYELFPIITKATIAKVIVSQIQRLGVANLHYEAAPLAKTSTSTNNIIDTNKVFNVDDDEVDQRNEISLTCCQKKEMLEIAISKKMCTRLPESGIDRTKKDLTRSIKKEIPFFETNGIRGKYLTLIYNYLLSIQPTSVESERAFSVAGCTRIRSRMVNSVNICTRIRSRMGDNSLNNLCFLRSYINNCRKS